MKANLIIYEDLESSRTREVAGGDDLNGAATGKKTPAGSTRQLLGKEDFVLTSS